MWQGHGCQLSGASHGQQRLRCLGILGHYLAHGYPAMMPLPVGLGLLLLKRLDSVSPHGVAVTC